MKNHARTLLGLLLLAPLLVVPTVVAAPAMAAAGDVPTRLSSNPVDISWQEGWQVSGGSECNAKAHWDATRVGTLATYRIVFKGTCRSGLAWGGYAYDETWKISGQTMPLGVSCSKTTKSNNKFKSLGSYTIEGTFVMGSMTVALPGEGAAAPVDPFAQGVCVPGTVRLNGRAENLSVPVGPPPIFKGGMGSGDTCAYGTPLRSVFKRYDVDDSQWRELYARHTSVEFKDLIAAGWVMSPVIKKTGGKPSMVGGVEILNGRNVSQLQANADGQPEPGAWPDGWQNTVPEGWLRYTAMGDGDQFVGVQLLHASVTGNAGYIDGDRVGPPENTAQGWQPYAGTTDAGRCAFWFGPKLWADSEPAAGNDEPWADSDEPGGEAPPDYTPLPDPEDPDQPVDPIDDKPDEGCNFSILDPGSWLSGGMCALVGLLGKVVRTLGNILGAVAGLPVAIAGLLIGVFEDAFVPDPESWGFPGLVEQFKSRPPGSLGLGAVAAVTSAAGSFGGSSCGVIADFTSPDTHGGAQIHCSAITGVPGWSVLYSLVQLGFIALTGLGLFRLFLGTFEKG